MHSTADNCVLESYTLIYPSTWLIWFWLANPIPYALCATQHLIIRVGGPVSLVSVVSLYHIVSNSVASVPPKTTRKNHSTRLSSNLAHLASKLSMTCQGADSMQRICNNPGTAVTPTSTRDKPSQVVRRLLCSKPGDSGTWGPGMMFTKWNIQLGMLAIFSITIS